MVIKKMDKKWVAQKKYCITPNDGSKSTFRSFNWTNLLKIVPTALLFIENIVLHHTLAFPLVIVFPSRNHNVQLPHSTADCVHCG